MNDSGYSEGQGAGNLERGRMVEVTTPEFRTLTTKTGRTGVRLERAFWGALDYLSSRAGQRRSRFVADIVETANNAGINASSAIRSTAIDLLFHELEAVRPLVQTSYLVGLLQTAPAPAFALDRNKRLIQSNPEFLRYLRTANGAIAGGAMADGAQLSIDRPLNDLFDQLKPGESTECGISIRFGNRERRTTARILMVPPAPVRVLVGYVLS